MHEERKLILATVLVLAFAVAMLISLPTINRIEKAAGYPYGKMCYSVFSGWKDTCP